MNLEDCTLVRIDGRINERLKEEAKLERRSAGEQAKIILEKWFRQRRRRWRISSEDG